MFMFYCNERYLRNDYVKINTKYECFIYLFMHKHWPGLDQTPRGARHGARLPSDPLHKHRLKSVKCLLEKIKHVWPAG